MRTWKHTAEPGRWRLAVMGGSRYRFGFQLKRAGWDNGRIVGFSAGLGLCVVTGIRRRRP